MATLLLLTIYMFSATATGELIKLPLLVSHYCDHKRENQNMGLLSFLVQHYVAEDGTDKDAAEDSQLPFKSADQLASFTFICLTPPSFIQLPAGMTAEPGNYFCIRKQDFHVKEHLSAIWQPPRYC